jgi:hypothetical protein
MSTTATTPPNTIPTPDWLQLRGGELRHNQAAHSVSVFFDGQLQYLLVALPAKGKHTCRISETINGRRIESPTVYDSPQAALEGGLNDLRGTLGW